MIEILKKEYWSKSEAFLLPLTGLTKSQKYHLRSYLFWDRYSIEDYNLVLKFSWDDYDEFIKYCRRVIFPVLDKNGYLIETYDFNNETIMILDVSQWALDIELFLKGKYSKFSKEAKNIITEFHTFFDKKPMIKVEISATLEPDQKCAILGNQTPIDYVAENYGIDLAELKKIGEIGGIYNKERETLVINQKIENGTSEN